MRLAGSRLQARKTGKRGALRLKLRSDRRISRRSRVVVRVTVAGRNARTVVLLEQRENLKLKVRR